MQKQIVPAAHTLIRQAEAAINNRSGARADVAIIVVIPGPDVENKVIGEWPKSRIRFVRTNDNFDLPADVEQELKLFQREGAEGINYREVLIAGRGLTATFYSIGNYKYRT